MSDFTVISDNEALELQKLRNFYNEIRNLTIQHDIIENDISGIAVVYPNNIATALSKVNPHWFHNDTVS